MQITLKVQFARLIVSESPLQRFRKYLSDSRHDRCDMSFEIDVKLSGHGCKTVRNRCTINFFSQANAFVVIWSSV